MKSFVLHLSFFILLITSCAPAPTPATPPPPSGSVLFEDEFELNTTGWDRFANEGGIMDYFEGGYRILVMLPGMNFWSTPEKDYGDVRIETEVLKLGGPEENRMGLMCRYQGGNYYFFIISSDGFYAVGKFMGGQTQLLGQSEMQASPLIQATVANQLRADCVGNTLSFFINDTQVASVQDGDLASGDIGVLVGSFSQPGVDVSFDHFVVIQP